jgi:hypothetical protein
MIGPARTPEFVQCGPNLEPLEPTPYLEWKSGQLYQWFEAKCTTAGHGGQVYTTGCWRLVSNRS